MKKQDVEIGEVYSVKVSGKLSPVKIISESEYGGWNGINEVTKRSVRIKTAGKLRRKFRFPNCRYCQNEFDPFDILRTHGNVWWWNKFCCAQHYTIHKLRIEENQ